MSKKKKKVDESPASEEPAGGLERLPFLFLFFFFDSSFRRFTVESAAGHVQVVLEVMARDPTSSED